MSDQTVPQVAVKTHLDGDPKPRPDEVAEWDAVRKEHGLEQMLVMILLPDESVTEGTFPGYQMHGWAIRDGEDGTVCVPEEIDVQVVDDEMSVEANADVKYTDGTFGFGHRIGS